MLLAVLDLCCCVSFSLAVGSGGCSLAVAFGLSSCGSQALEHRLGGCSACSSSACGIFPDQGSNLCLLPWQVDSLPLSHQGSPVIHFLVMRKPRLRDNAQGHRARKQGWGGLTPGSSGLQGAPVFPASSFHSAKLLDRASVCI